MTWVGSALAVPPTSEQAAGCGYPAPTVSYGGIAAVEVSWER
jgi:hypothetical protein